MSHPNYTPILKKCASDRKQRYLFQLNRLLKIARRIGKPGLIYALRQFIEKRGRE